jgi:hypothetical protein
MNSKREENSSRGSHSREGGHDFEQNEDEVNHHHHHSHGAVTHAHNNQPVLPSGLESKEPAMLTNLHENELERQL